MRLGRFGTPSISYRTVLPAAALAGVRLLWLSGTGPSVRWIAMGTLLTVV